jgi:hypothetical protein
MSLITPGGNVSPKNSKAIKRLMATLAKESGIENLAAMFYISVFADVNGTVNSSMGGAKYVPEPKLSKVCSEKIVLAALETLAKRADPTFLIHALTAFHPPQETQTDKKVV